MTITVLVCVEGLQKVSRTAGERRTRRDRGRPGGSASISLRGRCMARPRAGLLRFV